MQAKVDYEAYLKAASINVDINGSPTKMVVLSAKDNEMLTDMFKASATYLSSSSPEKQPTQSKMNP